MGMLRFLWQASKGYRLQPWKSPYLRWRIETYSGIKAESIDRDGFLSFVAGNYRELWRFLRWTAKIG
jgi:hypothetical protein